MFPACPWRLPAYTSVPARLAIGTQLALEAMDSPKVQAFAFAIRDACVGCTRAQLAEKILSTVQNVGYVADFPGDWMQPVEYTLDHGGDCEDLTNLLTVTCWLLGLYAWNVWLDQPKEKLNHITGAIGLPDGEVPSLVGAVPCKDTPIDGAVIGIPNVPGITAWWADTTVTGAYFGEWVYFAADRLNGRGVRDPGFVRPPGTPSSFRSDVTAEERAEAASTTAALTFVGDTLRVAGQTISAYIASGNNRQLALLRAAAQIRMEQLAVIIANELVPSQRAVIEAQFRALEDAKRQSEAALAAQAEQTKLYVGAGLAAVVILAGAYVYTQTQKPQTQKSNQKKAA